MATDMNWSTHINEAGDWGLSFLGASPSTPQESVNLPHSLSENQMTSTVMHKALKKNVLLVALLTALTAVDTNGAENRIWINGQIDNSPVRLFFDTAATHSVLFRRTADRLGLKITERPPGVQNEPGMAPVGGWTDPCRLSLDGLTFNERFAVIDLPPSVDTEAEGALSWRRMADAVLVFNPKEATLWISNAIPSAAKDWTKFALRKDSQILGFQAEASADEKYSIYIDTGSEGGVEVNTQTWNRLLSEEPEPRITLVAYYTPGAGLMVAEEIWVKKLTVGRLEIRDVPVRRENAVVSGALMPDHAATLGLYAMKRINVVVDYSNEAVYAHANVDPAPPYPQNRLGAVFVPRSERDATLVAHVAKGSPAEEAGIDNDDVLLRLGGLDATRWQTDPRLRPLGRFWQQAAGTKIELTLRRGATDYETVVTLRDILNPER